MLARYLRSSSWTVLALALISAGWSAQAQDALRPGAALIAPTRPQSLPDGADEAASAQRMILPEPPPAEVDLDVGSEIVTGSIPAPGAPRSGVTAPPPALPFDDTPVAAGAKGSAAAPTNGQTKAAAPAAIAATPPAAAGDIRPADAVPPAGPPVVPAPGNAAPAPVLPMHGLDADGLGRALGTYAAESPPGPTPGQSAERRSQRDAIAAFYATRGNAPIWIADGHLTPAARSVLARLDHAAEDGLDVTAYAVPVPRSDDTAVLATAELAVSEAAVAYAREASGSRVDIARLGGIIDLRPQIADAAQVLGALQSAPDAGEALHDTNPPHPGYAALRDKLAQLRQRRGWDAQNRIPPGPILKLGMSDARVPLIRTRFGLDVASVEPGRPPLVYDTRVAAAVAAFQRTHGLPASGQLTPRTIAALSGGNPTALENDIVANMELWRWMPRELGADRIEVNIPEYKARVVRDGAMVHETRVVVGQPDKPTPVFAQQMRFIIVNPYWNVPLSILKNEMMPKLAGDPNYFADHGYEVVERNGVTYVRQPPGDGNALGRIKFMFPNAHSVYLHDTNARSYFARDMRALSHGCVRVEEPFSFAEAVMGPDKGWSEARIKKLIGGQERTINLPKPLPIFITYFTAFVDDQSGFQMRDDVYGYTGKVKAALGLQG